MVQTGIAFDTEFPRLDVGKQFWLAHRQYRMQIDIPTSLDTTTFVFLSVVYIFHLTFSLILRTVFRPRQCDIHRGLPS